MTRGDSSTAHRFTARARCDEEVHLVNAPLDAVAFPRAYRTWCGRTVEKICEDGRPATCARCAEAAGGAPASSKASKAELRPGERVW